MSEKKIENANVNDEVKVNKVTGEVSAPADDWASFEVDPFADRRDSEGQSSASSEGESVVFVTPVSVQRMLSTEITTDKGSRKYYNYSSGYKVTLGGKEIIQMISLEPIAKRADIYDLLDGIFGDATSVPMEIVRTAITSTVNGVSKTNYRYTVRVSSKDDFGFDITCALNVSRGNTDKFNNLLARFKAKGIIS